MKVINNNALAANINFGALPYFTRGADIDKTELLAREAQYGKILGELKEDTFEPIDVILPGVDEGTIQETGLNLQDIEAARKVYEMLLDLRNSESLQQMPAGSQPGYGFEPHILDIRA